MLSSISIIIPTLGDCISLMRLLNSIQVQQLSKNQYEVLVIVNGLTDKALIDKLESLNSLYTDILKVYFIAIRGVNYARNFGLKQAKFPILLFLDDDCTLPNPNFFQEHIRQHVQNNQIFAIGGGYLLSKNAKYFDEIYNYLQMKWFVSGFINPEVSNKTHHLLGGNFSIKIELAKALKITFDDSILYGGSEYDFFQKADSAGLEILSNELDVIHYTHESFTSLTRKIFKQGRGKAQIDAKFLPYQYTETTKSIELLSIKDMVIRHYFNYVFWTGYYCYQKKYLFIILHISKEILQKINYYRYYILNKITKQLNNKKDKGDRF